VGKKGRPIYSKSGVEVTIIASVKGMEQKMSVVQTGSIFKTRLKSHCTKFGASIMQIL